MSGDLDADSLRTFIDDRGAPEWSVRVINRTEPNAIQGMIEDVFGSLSIDVTETTLPDADDDLVVLVRDGEVVASSPLGTFKETILLVNSDIHRTGTRSIEAVDPPDVIVQLSNAVFTLRGYPASNTEKLILTLVSRYIERQAWSHGDGTIRTGLQRLSRFDDERGTREVYERLGRVDGLDVDVYGVPDWTPPDPLDVGVHGVSDGEIERSWFVVYRAADATSVAMLAEEVDRNEWRGFWTVEADEVDAIDRYVRRAF